MASKSSIDVRLRLQGANKFNRDATGAGKAVGKIGQGGERAAKGLSTADRQSRRSERGFKSLGKAAALGFGALGGAVALGAAKNAVTATTDLTKSTALLMRVTDMDAAASSRWAAQAKVRGIDSKSLGMSLGTLSKNVSKATEGGETQVDTFKLLGISMGDVNAAGGDVGKLLPTLAQGFADTTNKADRNRAMMTLLGRGWQTLTPLMTDGSKGLQEQLKLADKYGVTMGGKPIETQKDLIAMQRELSMAQLGWQVTFSTEIAPKLTKAFGAILDASQDLKGVFRWADDHPGITKSVGALALLSVTMRRIPGGKWLTRHIGRGLATGLTKLFGGAGRKAGGRLAMTAADSVGSLIGPQMGKKRTTFSKVGGNTGKIIGRTAGASAATATAAGMVGGSAAGGGAAAAGGGLAGALKKKAPDFKAAGKTAGKGIGRGLGLGIATGIVLSGPEILKAIHDATSNVIIDFVKSKSDGGPIAGNAKGGLISRAYGGIVPRGDDTVTGVQYGEYVTRKQVVARHGAAAFDRLNQTGDASGFGGGETVVHTHINLDGRQVAESVDRHKRAARARS